MTEKFRKRFVEPIKSPLIGSQRNRSFYTPSINFFIYPSSGSGREGIKRATKNHFFSATIRYLLFFKFLRSTDKILLTIRCLLFRTLSENFFTLYYSLLTFFAFGRKIFLICIKGDFQYTVDGQIPKINVTLLSKKEKTARFLSPPSAKYSILQKEKPISRRVNYALIAV